MNETFVHVEVFSYTANGGHRLFTYIISVLIKKKKKEKGKEINKLSIYILEIFLIP